MSLILDNISKSFFINDGSVVEALSCITFEVANSEFVSVLGPS
jgi:ABC-type lipoprotein export system ATPase subunit